MRGSFLPAAGIAVVLLGACERQSKCLNCGTVVVAAVGEPSTLFPPLAYETVARDVGDLVYERLADLMPSRPTMDAAAYVPRLATRWERVDSLTWRFTLRDGARWHDGQPVTAEDVRYSFDVFADSVVDALPGSSLRANIAGVDVADSATVLVRFTRSYGEQLYDATYHVRIIPRHVWEPLGSRDQWPADTALAHLVGSGPYRIQSWDRGQSVTLLADSSFAPAPDVKRLIWRFTADPDAAANLLLSHQADLMETMTLAGAERLAPDTTFRLIPYPSANYGLIGFRISGGRPRSADAILGNREVRRALVASVDRTTIVRSILGPEAKVPPGPISQLLWIWDTSIKTQPYDTVAAVQALDAAGWTRGRNGMRAKGGRPLKIEVLVPSTSTPRRRAAEAVQAAWKLIGVDAAVTLVDFPIMQERIGAGQFDAFVGAWLDEPSPRGLADQWTRAGWDDLNHGHYANPVVDSLLDLAALTSDPSLALRLYHQVLDTLNADAPALFLYAPTNIAAVSRRLEQVSINPYSWISGVREWKLRESER